MPKPLRSRLLEVKIIAMGPTRWEWQVCDQDSPLMSGYQASRESAQTEGDSALFLLLRTGI
jgi:hypothetical protein